MRLIARSTIIASALAIVATAAPAASARPNLDPFTPGLSQSANSRPEVHANADHQGPQTDAVGIPPVCRERPPPSVPQTGRLDSKRRGGSPTSSPRTRSTATMRTTVTQTTSPRAVRASCTSYLATVALIGATRGSAPRALSGSQSSAPEAHSRSPSSAARAVRKHRPRSQADA